MIFLCAFHWAPFITKHQQILYLQNLSRCSRAMQSKQNTHQFLTVVCLHHVSNSKFENYALYEKDSSCQFCHEDKKIQAYIPVGRIQLCSTTKQLLKQQYNLISKRYKNKFTALIFLFCLSKEHLLS